jgi:hypothetical protein
MPAYKSTNCEAPQNLRVSCLVDDAFQVVLGLASLAAVAIAYPVEYEDFSHFAPAPVQYQHGAPLAKQLVVEKYVSS